MWFFFFWCYRTKCVNIEEMCITQWTHIFQITSVWWHSITYGWKSFKVQERPCILMKRAYKFIDKSAYSMLQLTNLWRLPLVEFWRNIIEEYPQAPEGLLKYFSFQGPIFVKTEFLPTLQPEQHIPTDWMQQLRSWLSIEPDVRH